MFKTIEEGVAYYEEHFKHYLSVNKPTEAHSARFMGMQQALGMTDQDIERSYKRITRRPAVTSPRKKRPPKKRAK